MKHLRYIKLCLFIQSNRLYFELFQKYVIFVWKDANNKNIIPIIIGKKSKSSLKLLVKNMMNMSLVTTTKLKKKISDNWKNYKKARKRKMIHGFPREDAVDDVLVLPKNVRA